MQMIAATFTLLMLVSAMAVTADAQGVKKVVFFGDSITELGVRPDGYVTQLRGIAQNEGQANRYDLVGAGVSGNKVYDLYLRLEPDVVKLSPDIVVIFIGVNDVWHKRLLGTGTDFDKFGKFYEAIVSRLEDVHAKVVLCTPAVIGERNDETNEFDGELNLYSQWIRTFAAKKKLPLVDLRRAFQQYEVAHNAENKASGILTTDKVHLNPAGNRIVAQEIWKVLRTL